MSMFAVKEYEREAFGTKVRFRDLTFGEAMMLSELNEEEMAIKALSLCLVEPKVTEDEVRNIPARYANDIKEIVQTAMGSDAK